MASALAAFCALTVVFLVYRDLFVPSARENEVWLGFEVTGPLALVTAPLHWAVFAIGAWGFWSRRPWIWTAATLYAAYVALSHLIWNLISPSGGGWSPGLWQFGLLLVPAAILLRVQQATRVPHDHEPAA